MSTAAKPAVAAPRPTWSARLFSLPTVLGMALVSMLFLITGTDRVVQPLEDPDVYWHLRDAWQLLHTGHFIRADSWTFTVGGKPWLDFEWLAELPYYFAFRWLGDSGLYVVMMVLLSAILVGMYALARLRSHDAKAAFVAAFIGLDFMTVSLGPRTLLFGWLFLTIELAILWNLREGRDYTAWLPPLFLLWINTHGSWLIGFALMAVYFACGLVGGEWGNLTATRWTRPQIRKFAIVTVVSFALLFINPYGWHLVAYPLDVAMQQKLTIEHIKEWFSLNFHEFRGKSTLVVLFLFGVLQLVRRRKWNLQDLVFLLIAIYGGFTYVRFVFLLGLVLVPLLAMELAGVVGMPYDATTDRRAPNAVALAVILAVIVAFWAPEKKIHLGIAETYPEKALPWVHSLAGQGNLFNDFEYGGYLEWQVPEVKEFIDGRTDIFVHEGVMQDYLDTIHLKDTFEVLDKYRIRYVLLGKDFPLAYMLQHSPDWKIAYQDDRAIGFERVH
ncbi:MAG TPA: hypothetical protein VMD92_12480 [Acidobacteriaceae bacterium]|jgi:hypothetical protein|nr:hypothetical protein [Acidobacteriaceae bacterium]